MIRELQRYIDKQINSAKAKARQVVRRSILKIISPDAGRSTVQVDVLGNEVADAIELFEQYGFRSVPSNNSEGLTFSIGGDKANQVGILFSSRNDTSAAADDLNQGDVCVYNRAGSKVVLRQTGDIEIENPVGSTITMTASGNIEIYSTAQVKLGDQTAALGVARQTDPVMPTAEMITWMSQVAAAINALAPGSVTPPAVARIGEIMTASSKVVSS